MRFVPTPLDGAFVIELDKREDDRGFFARVFFEREFAAAGFDTRFVQINNSLSKDKGTLPRHALPARQGGRGKGRALRARRAVGCDPRSAAGVGEFRAELWRRAHRRVPAHDVCAPRLCPRLAYARRGYRGVYLVSAFYAPERERGVRWNDPRFAIRWPAAPQVISDKDAQQRDLRPGLALGRLSGLATSILAVIREGNAPP